MEKLLHSISSAGDTLGVSRVRVYDLGRRGEIEIVKIGARSLVTDRSLREFVERLRAAPLYPSAKRLAS